MNKIVLTTLMLALTTTLFSQKRFNKFAVFFGERTDEFDRGPEHVVRLFLDRNGHFYPPIRISDKSMKKSGSELQSWYRDHPGELAALLARYEIAPELTWAESIRQLNEALAQEKLTEINEKADSGSSVNVLIHGFRKMPYGDNGKYGSYSTADNALLRRMLNHENALFVEVYWDGTFITGLKAVVGKKSFRLFEKSAIPNAKRVGQGLRKIISNIETDWINVVTHSLGAVVGSELLFNSVPSEEQTPDQSRVNICYIAPGIGSETFAHYYDRISAVDFEKEDNYRVAVIYNEHDYVLEKTFKFPIFGKNFEPTEFGNTSLGCNCGADVGKLERMFSERFTGSEPLKIYDFSFSGRGRPMGCHHVGCYVRHEKFTEVLAFLRP